MFSIALVSLLVASLKFYSIHVKFFYVNGINLCLFLGRYSGKDEGLPAGWFKLADSVV